MPALCRFNYDTMPSLMSPNLSICDLDLWPLTMNMPHIACDVMITLPNLSAIELLLLQCSTLWPGTCFKGCAWLWDNFYKVWPLKTYPYLNYSVFWCWCITSRCDLDLWPVNLEILIYIKRHVIIKVCTKFERNRAIPGWIIDNFANVCTRYVTLWTWPLTSWAWTFSGVMRLNSIQNLSEIE